MVLEGAAVGVTSSSLVPLALVMQPAAEASLRVALNLGGQPREVLDSQGRRNNGDPQRRCVGISVSSVRHRVIDELDVFIDYPEQRLLVLPPAEDQAPRVGL
jgi:hypothetical protein